MKFLAQVKLKQSSFDVVGPSELIEWISKQGYAGSDSYNNYINQWYVVCATSNIRIPINNLKYWNVDKQEVYASAECVPLNN